MTDLTRLTLAEARDKLHAREISARELTQAHLDAIDGAAALNAYLVATPDRALAQADAADQRLADGTATAMTGIPLAIKDLFCTQGVATTAASHMLEGFVPPYESTVTANLWADGAVMLGKTNLDEFAMGSSNEHSYFGPVKNPWRAQGDNTDRVAGGSSGGSAAAVAARLALGSTGTDTGGSIRQPASLTGIVGMKPTYGRCSRWGVVAFASSLDHPGPFSRTVRDNAILLASMAGYDAKDSTSVDRPVHHYESALTGDIKGFRIGVPKEYVVDAMPEEISALWRRGMDWLRYAGAEVVEVSLPHTQYALPAYYIIAPAEASSNLARYDGVRYGLRETVEGGGLADMYEATRGAGFGPEVQRRIMIGTYVLSAGYYDAYYLKAQKVRTLIKRDFDAAFGHVDALLTPTAPNAAFPLGAKLDDPLAMYLNDVFTVTANLAGVPALSVPAGLSSEGLPLGLQVIGKAFDEETVYKVGHVLETAAGFAEAPEPWWATA
ncbi:aspartyl/glutamyl-tRNA amidotransferase subunit A [Rhodothalassium salexigens]|uniref:Asp-tRNA(Asn)/Glu-tRNA(Gln) amidotransferase subunit GatA n=1 Tax=Rhodothalassium salexigens TaxID=1086 RepID=UPI001912F343|nr:Asp-tRNA(Asn)/Glu-tRNA(Gln) amidotransferase subunit GatA [Rhodothalassium salexigens]MBK5911500.1 aspartyl/glutamyl-tRNA amidotransferase subunit A [Rhodothalassium salexigens]MBK5919673.1 aspartyl/glutamyl-tRNA amidotransferase subunit A [Rhodothalassium salexigens]